MKEILEFINNNLENIINKKSCRLDYTTQDKATIKIYKCGSNVTRIDIVKKEGKDD